MHVTLQADNCVSQNKNTHDDVISLAWRVITGQYERIELNFMLPGHTYFGLFKKYYHRQDHVDYMAGNSTAIPSPFTAEATSLMIVALGSRMMTKAQDAHHCYLVQLR